MEIVQWVQNFGFWGRSAKISKFNISTRKNMVTLMQNSCRSYTCTLSKYKFCQSLHCICMDLGEGCCTGICMCMFVSICIVLYMSLQFFLFCSLSLSLSLPLSLSLSLSLSLTLSFSLFSIPPSFPLPPHLVFVARSLAVLCQCDQSLRDELHIIGMDVETQQYQTTRGHSTHTVQEL